MDWVRRLIAEHGEWSRKRLAQELCRQWGARRKDQGETRNGGAIQTGIAATGRVRGLAVGSNDRIDREIAFPEIQKEGRRVGAQRQRGPQP